MAAAGRLVAYERVSTARQGLSGLGLEAQRKAIGDFASADGAEVLARFTEVESGRKADRPELARALVIVDVGPEISAEGAKTIQNFVVNNLEFDDLEQFLDNVERYDPFRTRAHMERTVKYNVLR